MVAVGVLPVLVIPAGLLVIVQEGEGKPLNSTEPVDMLQVGWVIIPTIGAAGALSSGLIATFNDGEDVHPWEVTVNVYVVPGMRPVVMVVVGVLLPDCVIPAGLLFTVQLPDEGNPFNTTLTVGSLQVGCLIVPMTGADGITV
jgi:hypothetical protein